MSGVLGDMMMMSSAQKAYDEQSYLKAYQTLAGKGDLDKEGARLRNKAKMMAYLQTKYDEYVICMDSGKQTNSGLSRYTIRTNYQLALDSLIQGAYYYQKNEAKAKKLDITAEYDEYGDRLINELNQTFHVSLGEAVDLYHNNTRKNYTAALQKIVYAAGFKDSY